MSVSLLGRFNPSRGASASADPPLRLIVNDRLPSGGPARHVRSIWIGRSGFARFTLGVNAIFGRWPHVAELIGRMSTRRAGQRLLTGRIADTRGRTIGLRTRRCAISISIRIAVRRRVLRTATAKCSCTTLPIPGPTGSRIRCSSASASMASRSETGGTRERYRERSSSSGMNNSATREHRAFH